MADGTYTCLRHFVPEKSASCGVDKPKKKGQTWKNLGNRWQINSALIAKIDLLFLLTDLQVAINLKNRLDFFFHSQNNRF